MTFDIYRDHIIDHATRPHNFGQLTDVFGIQVDNPTCGDELTLYIQIKEDNVEKVMFTGICCALSTASASLVTDYISKKAISELKSITPGDIYNLFGVPVSASRSNCVLLIYLALEKWLALEDSKEAPAMVQS